MTRSLFSPLALGRVELPNRIAVSPMAQYSSDADGCASDWHLAHLGQLCYSGAGLLMTEATAVEPAGRGSLRCLGLYGDAQEQALARVVAFCKQWGSARVGVQLSHAGRKASIRPPWAGRGPLPPEEGGWQPLAPSALAGDAGAPVPQALDEQGIARIRQAFVDAAARAARTGFDVVELHAAHGYLLHQFLSPLSNQRGDAYGGSAAGRMRLPLEIAEQVRAALPADRALGVRISASDWAEGGFGLDDAVALAGALKEIGCDYVCVSSGGLVGHQRISVGPGYQVPFAAAVRERTGIATRAVGLISRPEQADAIVRSGEADFVALGRAMLDDPRWGWHAADALGGQVPYPKQYERAASKVWPGARPAR
ncbi:NADPH dehydrogenase [Pigmentiphaga humi]|uniref:NADPH dehydrogenase n=1 Tax=Pigmentiphaga humi TaxID=2478468 RepID=A0A3P4B4U4_9BURK|nr:NADH:flavin oxidoreductase/NADH oxidase [Pigmentiphaga humi]VCU70941.1 NADPH dehydrogenase [Pigmentiphaga humi]